MTSYSRRDLLLAALAAPIALRVPDALAAATCKPASSSALGVDYRPGAPVRTGLLVDAAEPGNPLRVTGLVTAADSCRRLRDVTIEVWQADSTGRYDNETAKLRGTFTTDALGRYKFDTVVPGHVGDRARTIRFKITAKGYETQITQLFFAGDERERADTAVKPELVVTLGDAKDAARPGMLLANFDLSLTPEKQVDAATAAGYAAYAGSYELWMGEKMTISVEERRLRWTLSRSENPGEPVTGLLYPREGSTFFRPEYDDRVQFVKDETGKVTHALIRDKQVAKKLA